MARLVALVVLLAAVGGCALAEAGLPSEQSALDELDGSQVLASDLVVAAFGADVVGDWQRETIEEACAMSCRSCADTHSTLVLPIKSSLDDVMVPMSSAAEAIGGSAGEVELFGETYVLYLTVADDQGDEHRIRVSLEGKQAEVLVRTGCYKKAVE